MTDEKKPKRVRKKKVSERDAVESILSAETAKHSRLSRVKVGNDLVRMKAGFIFVTDVNGITLRQLNQHPEIKGHVTTETLQTWCNKDKWVERRAEAMAQIRAKLDNYVVKALETNYQRELQALDKLEVMAWQLIPSTPPKSWEGVAKILMDLMSRRADLAEKFRDGIIDSDGRTTATEGEGAGVVKHELDPAEVRELAAKFTQKDRGALRARIAKRKKADERKEARVAEAQGRDDQGDEPADGGPGRDE